MKSVDALVSGAARVQVCFQNLFDRFPFPSFCCRKHVFDDPGNFIEADLPVQESRHCYFVGGIQGYGLGTTRLRSLIGQSETPEFPHIRRVEVQLT